MFGKPHFRLAGDGLTFERVSGRVGLGRGVNLHSEELCTRGADSGDTGNGGGGRKIDAGQ